MFFLWLVPSSLILWSAQSVENPSKNKEELILKQWSSSYKIEEEGIEECQMSEA